MNEMNLQEIIEARLTEDAFDLPVIDHTALKLQEIMASSTLDIRLRPEKKGELARFKTFIARD